MWAVWTNAIAAALALINFWIGAGGELNWVWLISSACFALSAVKCYKKIRQNRDQEE